MRELTMREIEPGIVRYRLLEQTDCLADIIDSAGVVAGLTQ